MRAGSERKDSFDSSTHWSVVLGAGAADPDLRRRSLETLCRKHWKSVYVHIMATGPRDDADDLAQAFFEFVIENDVIPRADPQAGRFRTFLKAVLKNFLSDRRRFDGRIKRGGGRRFVSIEEVAGFGWSPACADGDPPVALDRQWARDVMDASLARLKSRLEAQGRQDDLRLFEAYTTTSSESGKTTYGTLARDLGTNEWGVWKRLNSVREELRRLVREEVAQTVSEPQKVEEELRALMEFLR